MKTGSRVLRFLATFVLAAIVGTGASFVYHRLVHGTGAVDGSAVVVLALILALVVSRR